MESKSLSPATRVNTRSVGLVNCCRLTKLSRWKTTFLPAWSRYLRLYIWFIFRTESSRESVVMSGLGERNGGGQVSAESWMKLISSVNFK